MKILGKVGYSGDVLNLGPQDELVYRAPNGYRTPNRLSKFAPYVMALSALAGACANNGNGGCPTCPSPTKVTVSGDVTNRINGGAAGEGSTIQYTGPETKSAPISNGRYQIPDLLAGNYQVKISGQNHVEHTTQIVPVSASGSFPFSLLVWGSSKFGVAYDQSFDNFFNIISGRGGPNGVLKWDLQRSPPREIYVTQEGLSPEAFAEFMDILREVNNENTSDEYCGRVGPLPITVGPPIGDSKDGAWMIRFRGSGGNITDYPLNNNQIIYGGRTQFRIGAFDNSAIGDPVGRVIKKYIVAHEKFHNAYAYHPSNFDMGGVPSLMDDNGDRANLTPFDKLASCVVYSDGTRPGNKPPDANPSYR